MVREIIYKPIKYVIRDVEEVTVEDLLYRTAVTGANILEWCNGTLYHMVAPRNTSRNINEGRQVIDLFAWANSPEYGRTMSTSENIKISIIDMSNNSDSRHLTSWAREFTAGELETGGGACRI